MCNTTGIPLFLAADVVVLGCSHIQLVSKLMCWSGQTEIATSLQAIADNSMAGTVTDVHHHTPRVDNENNKIMKLP